jgi:hypothetical protein
MSLMAISSLLKSKGITPDITSIASRLAVDGKPRIIGLTSKQITTRIMEKIGIIKN